MPIDKNKTNLALKCLNKQIILILHLFKRRRLIWITMVPNQMQEEWLLMQRKMPQENKQMEMIIKEMEEHKTNFNLPLTDMVIHLKPQLMETVMSLLLLKGKIQINQLSFRCCPQALVDRIQTNTIIKVPKLKAKYVILFWLDSHPTQMNSTSKRQPM